MNVNQKIEEALSDLVNGNIWPLACPLESRPDEFIVYLPEDERPVEFGDDNDLVWVHYMEINWFKRDRSSKKPVNYLATRKQIRQRLKEKGFSVTDIIPQFEGTRGENGNLNGYTHLIILCNIEEEDPYGEM